LDGQKHSAESKIENHVKVLQNYVPNREVENSLVELHKAAKVGLSYRRWLKRFFFGFSLADSIEQWVLNFNPSPGKSLQEQVPLQETRNVVSAWVRVSFFRSLVLLLLSSAITIVTAVFLYRQIIKQDELIGVQEKQNHSENYLRNIRTLYDETCYKKNTISKPESQRVIVHKSSVSIDNKTEVCLPIHNYRLRAESLKALVKDAPSAQIPDLSYAHVVDIDFRGDEMRETITTVSDALSNINLSGANLQELDLEGASLGHANLSEVNLLGASLVNAYMRGVSLENANLYSAKINGANLHSANLEGASLVEADLSNADLSLANFKNANLIDTVFIGAAFDCTNFSESTNPPNGWETRSAWNSDRCKNIRKNRGW